MDCTYDLWAIGEAILDQGIVLKDHPERIDFELRKKHEIKDFKAFRKYIDAA